MNISVGSSVRCRGEVMKDAYLPHARLAPHPTVSPSLQSKLVVALLPNEDGARLDEHGPFDLVEPSGDRL